MSPPLLTFAILYVRSETIVKKKKLPFKEVGLKK